MIDNLDQRQIAWLNSKDGEKKIGISLYMKEFPEIKHGWDSTWIVGDFYFQDNVFSIALKDTPMYELPLINNLIKDLANIDKSSHGKAQYSGTEPYIKFDIDIKITGTGIVTGEIWNVHPESCRFNFTFETDQTCTKQFCMELKQIASQIKM